jgi:integrase
MKPSDINLKLNELTDLWIKSVGYSHSGSARTKQNYNRVLPVYCNFIGQTPEQIVADYEKAENNHKSDRVIMRKHSQKIQLWIMKMEKENKVPSTIRTNVAIVLSFYKYNDLPLGKVPMPQLVITYHNRDITREEINKILALSPLRERAVMAIIAQSGLRPCTVVKLRVKDVENILEQETPIPCKISVAKEIEKGKLGCGHPSFIAEDAVKYLKQYLGTRKNLTLESLLFVTYQTPEQPLIEKNLSRVFRLKARILCKSGSVVYNIRENGKPSELRLYNLRKYFRKFANQMGFEHVNYLMNHKTEGSDGNYTPKDAEFYRQLYAEKAMPFLRLEQPTPTESQQVITAMEDLHKKELETLKTDYEEKAQKQINELQKQMQEIIKQVTNHKEIAKSINLELGKTQKQ